MKTRTCAVCGADMRNQKAGQKNAGKVLCKTCGLDWDIQYTGEVVQVPQRQPKPRQWTVVVKDLGTGERYLVSVATETNYRAAAKVKALDIVYALPGMTWQANLFVTACMRVSSGKAA